MEQESGQNIKDSDGCEKKCASDSPPSSTDKSSIKSPSLVTHTSSPENTPKDSTCKPKQNDETQNVGISSAPVSDVQVEAKKVRFSICEYITETFVQDYGNGAAHTNQSFVSDETMPSSVTSTDGSDERNKIRYIRGKARRDSAHPLVFPEPNSDPWAVDVMETEEEDSSQPSWSELSTNDKIFRVLTGIFKFVALLALLYFFVCSLDLLSLGFRLIGGNAAGEIFRRSSILQNPVVGVMIGILTTVLVQSSSTSSSIIVGMVAAGFMDVRLAIPLIMGANIGTSITNTIVAFTQAGEREQFRRAFAGATVLDMFNWLTVIVLLPIEMVFGYLYHVSLAAVDLLLPDSESGGEIQLLSVITNPFVDLIVQLDDAVLDCWVDPTCTSADNSSLIKEFCKTKKTEITVNERVVDVDGNEILNIKNVIIQNDLEKCDFLFAGTSLSDAAAGAIILVSSLIVLCFCLVLIVKLLSSVLKGHVLIVIKHTLNADIPYVPWITGYLAILIGAFMTFLVQSSSVFTSALTPLVGLGVISLNRIYPLTLGANIGTTTTSILASMAAEGKALHPSLQIALCHFFFNVTGVLLFYPVPFLRFPIGMAKALGNTTANYRWFAVFYIVMMFAVGPVIFITLSLAGSIYVIVLVAIIGIFAALIAILTTMQKKIPQILPKFLRDWKWLPRPMRSLQPYDNFISSLPCCRANSRNSKDDESDDDSFTGQSYKDNNFIFVTGNNIPPPNQSEKDGPTKRSSGITRIIPTRVIRNINSGTNEYNQVNDTDSNSSDNKLHAILSPANNDVSNAQNGVRRNSSITSNRDIHEQGTIPPPSSTIPIPEDDESPNTTSVTVADNTIGDQATSSSKRFGDDTEKSAYSPIFTSTESFMV